MIPSEMKEQIKTMPRLDKVWLIQFIAELLADEEEAVSRRVDPEKQHGLWSQYNAFDAANELQKLLATEAR